MRAPVTIPPARHAERWTARKTDAVIARLRDDDDTEFDGGAVSPSSDTEFESAVGAWLARPTKVA